MGCGKSVDQDGEKPIEGLLLMPWFDTLMKDSQHSTWPTYVSYLFLAVSVLMNSVEQGDLVEIWGIPVNTQNIKDILVLFFTGMYMWLLAFLMDIDDSKFLLCYITI